MYTCVCLCNTHDTNYNNIYNYTYSNSNSNNYTYNNKHNYISTTSSNSRGNRLLFTPLLTISIYYDCRDTLPYFAGGRKRIDEISSRG